VVDLTLDPDPERELRRRVLSILAKGGMHRVAGGGAPGETPGPTGRRIGRPLTPAENTQRRSDLGPG